jgi:hypothetical protein
VNGAVVIVNVEVAVAVVDDERRKCLRASYNPQSELAEHGNPDQSTAHTACFKNHKTPF